MKEKKMTHGGARPGAGRPKGDSELFSFRCPGDLAGKLRAQDNRTEFIRRSLRKAIEEKESGPVSPGPDFLGPVSLGTITPASEVHAVHLPFYDQRVVAGFPVPLDNDECSQDINLLSMLCPHPESCYLIRVKGDSMTDAGIMSGDIVIVDKSNRNPGPKEIAVCELNGEYTLKHFVEEDGIGWLVPDNPEYPRFMVTEGDEFSIWGTVTYIIHKAKE